MPRSKTLALMYPRHDPKTHWASKAFRARAHRLSFAITKKRLIAEDAARQRALASAHEKAPDLATEGFDDAFIPVEEPGTPQIRRLS